jgi:hypothetical protein
MKDDEMDKVCGTRGRDEKYTKNCIGKSAAKTLSGTPRRSWEEDNIKIDLKNRTRDCRHYYFGSG